VSSAVLVAAVVSSLYSHDQITSFVFRCLRWRAAGPRPEKGAVDFVALTKRIFQTLKGVLYSGHMFLYCACTFFSLFREGLEAALFELNRCLRMQDLLKLLQE
jgi:hypothetical protein